MREAELYPAVKRHFEGLGYAVYAEVPAPHGGYVDLLAVREPVTVAVELKPWFSRGAVRQTGRNKRYVWESYVAVPNGVRIPPRRRGALKRHRAGLLLVKVATGDASGQAAEADSEVQVEVEARRLAPAWTVREAFGPHLHGALALVYAAALGGVPTRKRVSASSLLVEKIKESLEGHGGLANIDQILADIRPWNYFRNPRGGVRWILERRFQSLGPDLWTLKRGPRASSPRRNRRKPANYTLPLESLVRTHLPDTLHLPACTQHPAPAGGLSEFAEGRPAVAPGASRVCHPARHRGDAAAGTPRRAGCLFSLAMSPRDGDAAGNLGPAPDSRQRTGTLRSSSMFVPALRSQPAG